MHEKLMTPTTLPAFSLRKLRMALVLLGVFLLGATGCASTVARQAPQPQATVLGLPGQYTVGVQQPSSLPDRWVESDLPPDQPGPAPIVLAELTEARPAPSLVVVDHVRIDSRCLMDGVWGVRVSFSHRWSGLPEGATGTIAVRFATADGRPLRTTVESPALRDRQGHLRLEASSSTEGGAMLSDLFVPFYAIDLPAGAHQIVPTFEAERTDGLRGRVDHPLRIDDALPPFTIVKPPTREINVLVTRVEVAPGQYDAALFRLYKARPDLYWRVRFGSRPGSVVHASRIHNDTYNTEWNRATSTITWSEGDQISIDVLDADVTLDDLLASFTFTYEQLLMAYERGRPLSRGAVRHLSLEVMMR